MIPALSIMIGAYIITRMLALLVTPEGERVPVRIAAFLTMIVAVVSVGVIVNAGARADASFEALTNPRAAVVPAVGSRQAARAAMQSDLRQLVGAQEIYYAEHERYTDRVGDLKGWFSPSPGVTLTIQANISYGVWAWTATARDADVPGLVCSIATDGTVSCEGP